jgi:chaperone modulatory protein CbpM
MSYQVTQVTQVTSAVWLNEGEVCTIEELAEASGLSRDEVDDLVVSGVIWPADAAAQPHRYHLLHVVTVRQARRLRDDFELDSNGVALAMTLLRRIRALELALSMPAERRSSSATSAPG